MANKPFKKILSDDDKVMRDLLAKEMLRKIEKRIEGNEDNALKTIKSFLSDERKNESQQKEIKKDSPKKD